MSTLVRVEAELAARIRRERLFAPALFADPAWDLLLELYRAYLSGAVLTPEELGRLSAVAESSVHRWLKVLERQGLVSCVRGLPDGVCEAVTLTSGASDALGRYFEG